ncbi:uncharacterized protein N7459_004484 [Penicillium hispanicum]|uniref:uncharacterized protein n=1 Tax=Penicillium hispanicum TaxID=1080232 RepID=UPI0025417FCB|nr:uncharacterized protein N7459_004484 [Penicillium hispanicum]KAJ5584684.1 hypothetical protein N7459_004484 [Penicillium hispanicum]
MKVECERVLAALLAAQPGIRLDYNAIARMYGQGAKYNTMEHKFRGYRKFAEELTREAGDEPNLTPRPRTTRAPRTGPKSTGSRKKGKAAKGTEAEMSIASGTEGAREAPIQLSDDNLEAFSPIKSEIKKEQDDVSSIMGIKKHPLEDLVEVEDNEEPAFKRQKHASGLVKAPLFNSQENGYVLPQIDGSNLDPQMSIPDTTAHSFDTMLYSNRLHDGASYYFDEA